MTDNITFQSAVLQTEPNEQPQPLSMEENIKNKCELLSFQIVQLQKLYDELDAKNKQLEQCLQILFSQLEAYENEEASSESSEEDEKDDKDKSETVDLVGSVVLEEKQN
jgi:hypothetical protein